MQEFGESTNEEAMKFDNSFQDFQVYLLLRFTSDFIVSIVIKIELVIPNISSKFSLKASECDTMPFKKKKKLPQANESSFIPYEWDINVFLVRCYMNKIFYNI